MMKLESFLFFFLGKRTREKKSYISCPNEELSNPRIFFLHLFLFHILFIGSFDNLSKPMTKKKERKKIEK